MEVLRREIWIEVNAWGRIFLNILATFVALLNKILDYAEYVLDLIGGAFYQLALYISNLRKAPSGLPILPELPEFVPGPVRVPVRQDFSISTKLNVNIITPHQNPTRSDLVSVGSRASGWLGRFQGVIPVISLDVFLIATLVLATFALGLAVLHFEIGPRGMSYTLRQAAGLLIILFNAVVFSDWTRYLHERRRFDHISSKFKNHPRVIWVALTALGVAFLVGFEIKTTAFLTYIIALVNMLGVIMAQPARTSYWLLMTLLASLVILIFAFPLIFAN